MKSSLRNMALVVFLASAPLLSAMSANAACVDQSIIYGQTVNGSLSATDCTDFGATGATYYADYYLFTGTAGDKITIQQSSSSIDPWLMLIFPSGGYTNNDDGGGGTTARIPATSGYYTLPESGTYRLEATSAISNTTGSYTLTLAKEASATGTLPSAPTNVTATAGDGSATVTFTPGSIGSGTLVEYWVACDIVGDTVSGNALYGHAVSLPITVTGLTNGTAYSCGGLTRSTVGDSAWSARANPVTPTAATASVPASGTAVEFYNAGINHYFMTASPDEAVALDNKPSWGWVRTCKTFDIWLTQASAPGNASPVCRFFGVFSNGTVGSHFYTVDPVECANVKGRLDWGWGYENDAFYAVKPVGIACQSGTSPVYRVYNNGMGGAPNHRYMANQADVSTMISKGWVSEGVAMCAPSGTSSGGTTSCGSGGGGVGTTTTIGTNGGTVTNGSTSITIPANAVTTPTSVTISPGSTTNDYPDATVVSDVITVELDGDTYKPIQIQMAATGTISEKVFAVVATDTYNPSSDSPVFRGRLFEASVNGNTLSLDIPQSALANQNTNTMQSGHFLKAASASSDKAKRKFTIWFITGYTILQSSHFSISYPVRPCNSLVIRDYLQYAEDAYKRLITDIGFLPDGLSWPMELSVIALATTPEMLYGQAGYTTSVIVGRGTKSIAIDLNQYVCNSTSQTDMDEMKVTIGHEFFHTIQYVYDPHWALRELIHSPFTWLYEASSVWFEAEILNNPSYVSTVFGQGAEFYHSGLEHGIKATTHGYGAHTFLRYLTEKFGNGLILSIWTNVKNQSSSSTGALASANIHLSSEWQIFAEQLLTGNTIASNGLTVGTTPGFSYVYREENPSAEFNDDLYPLSAVKILLDFKKITQNKKFTITLSEGKNSFIKAYLYKSKIKVAEFTDTYTLDVKPLDGFYLIVANSNDVAPYTTPTHIKVKLDSDIVITALAPATGQVGTPVTITGTGFGTTKGTVTFNGTTATASSWSDTQIKTTVPTGATTGNVVVKNSVTGVVSNGVNFTVSGLCGGSTLLPAGWLCCGTVPYDPNKASCVQNPTCDPDLPDC